ncbi:MAG: hypothetical protein ABIZ34_01610 [Candidatus Limnocylindrales bacterium]
MDEVKPAARGQSSSRRALLGGAAGAAAALGIRGLAGPDRAEAQAQALYANAVNQITSYTSIRTPVSNDSEVFFGSPGVAVGVNSHVADGRAVDAYADGPRSVAVRAGTIGSANQTAVLADGSAGLGEGLAVKAITKNGVALYGEAVGGHALNVRGTTVFSRSGVVRILQGASSKTVTLYGVGNYVTTNSFVLATIQGNIAGVWVRGCTTNPGANSFTIRLNKAAPSDVKVGWIVLS